MAQETAVKARDCYLVTCVTMQGETPASARCPYGRRCISSGWEARLLPLSERSVRVASTTTRPASSSRAPCRRRRSRKVEGHLAGCRDCRALVAALAGDAAPTPTRRPCQHEKLVAVAGRAAAARTLTIGDRVGRYLVLSVARRRRHGRRVRGLRSAARSQGRAQAPARRHRGCEREGRAHAAAARGPGDGPALAPERRRRLRRRHHRRRRPLHRDGVRRGRHADDVAQASSRARGARSSTCSCRRRAAWPPRTRPASCTATSSPTTCSSAATAACASPTSASRARVIALDEARAAAAAAAAGAGAAATSTLTATGTVLGTPRYMAPEQLTGPDIDARADQFSFCVALYEALYGTHPLPGATSVSMLEKRREGAAAARGHRRSRRRSRAPCCAASSASARSGSRRWRALMLELVPPPQRSPAPVRRARGSPALLVTGGAVAAVMIAGAPRAGRPPRPGRPADRPDQAAHRQDQRAPGAAQPARGREPRARRRAQAARAGRAAHPAAAERDRRPRRQDRAARQAEVVQLREQRPAVAATPQSELVRRSFTRAYVDLASCFDRVEPPRDRQRRPVVRR